jgi:hypothetical protein
MLGAVATLGFPAGGGWAYGANTDRPCNLVPRDQGRANNYWCTWAAQNYMYGQGQASLDSTILEGESGAQLARKALTETIVFGASGWAKEFFPRVRSELLFLFDDGWETGGNASFELDTAKFPSFSGSEADRLRKLNHAIKECGWQGAALWCRNPPDGKAGQNFETLSSNAGIDYWKIDIGDPTFALIKLRDKAGIPLVLEYACGGGPLNGDWHAAGVLGPQRWDSGRMEILRNADVYRIYDTTSMLSLPTTLDRVSQLLDTAQGHPEVHGLLNAEDEVYIAAALGCTMGVMRCPLIGLRPGKDIDLFFNGPRQTKRRMDEVTRAVRWQRIAPPFAAGAGSVRLSSEILTDSWTFRSGETWMAELAGATAYQGAPAYITRNLDLPEVKAGGDKPFIFAARFPNGAVAVAAQERTRVDRAWYMPSCDISLTVADARGPFGVFGDFGDLTLIFDRPPGVSRILAQDLAGDTATDITARVRAEGRTVRIPREVIRSAGLRDRTEGDLSSPGAVFAVL